jgi:mannobiose 2-epimerase
MDAKQLLGMRNAIQRELSGNILPFWTKHAPDETRGGFIGRLSNDLVPDLAAPKGLIVTARILWTFSAAFRRFPEQSHLRMAERAYHFLMERFWDAEFGGAFWMVDPYGRPLDTKKKVYGQAFLLYALAEYVRTTRNPAALDKARHLFQIIEEHGYDKVHTGYFETYERNWILAADLRLSEKDLNEAKSMNTHLHLMEAYANLFRVWTNPLLEERLRSLIRNFTDRILDRTHFRLICFFDEAWEPRSNLVSYGHDIETSWLLCEAADVLGDGALEEDIRSVAVRMAQAVIDWGRDVDGSLFYEAEPSGIMDSDKHFWVQAEAVVGFLNAFQLSGKPHFLEAAGQCWTFIQDHLVDRRHGDWLYRVSKDGKPILDVPKISEWKCPYHSGRMCMESMERLDQILKRNPA